MAAQAACQHALRLTSRQSFTRMAGQSFFRKKRSFVCPVCYLFPWVPRFLAAARPHQQNLTAVAHRLYITSRAHDLARPQTLLVTIESIRIASGKPAGAQLPRPFRVLVRRPPCRQVRLVPNPCGERPFPPHLDRAAHTSPHGQDLASAQPCTAAVR